MAEEETKVQADEENDFNSSGSPSEQLPVMSPTPSEILRPEG